MYGDLRKKVKVQVAGQEMELEQYQDEQDDETIKYSTEPLASRNSFINMRNQMQAQVTPVVTVWMVVLCCVVDETGWSSQSGTVILQLTDRRDALDCPLDAASCILCMRFCYMK